MEQKITKSWHNYTYMYLHPAVTAGCVVFGFDVKDIKVLLLSRYSSAIGFRLCADFAHGYIGHAEPVFDNVFKILMLDGYGKI